MDKDLIRKALELGMSAFTDLEQNTVFYYEEQVEAFKVALAELDRPEAEPARTSHSPCQECESEWCEGCKWEHNSERATK